jgi:GNAT superfamily N-acetyltransferase
MTPSPCTELAVRRARTEDLAVCQSFAARFLETHYAGLLTPNPAKQAELMAIVLEQGGFWVLTAGDTVVGMLGMLLAPLPTNDELAGIECAWWVEPAYRRGGVALELLSRAEAWAVDAGARVVQVMQPAQSDARLGALYARIGYVPLETTWQKRVGGTAWRS